MDYPNGFDIPTFTAAEKLAVARTFGVWTGIALVIIIFLAAIAVWSVHSIRIKPYLLSVDAASGEWVATFEEKSDAVEYPAWRTMQEALAIRFAQNWLSISRNAEENNINWCKCDKSQCISDSKTCALCCESGGDLFNKFTSSTLPDYQFQIESGEVRKINTSDIVIKPLAGMGESGGNWRIYGKMQSYNYGLVDMEIYVKIARAENAYPLTLGYYVVGFNAYTMGAE